MERIFGLLRSGYRSLALAGVIALGLAGASIPDARAADGRFYVGLNVPIMFIDDTESTTTGAQALNIRAPDERQRYKAKSTAEYDTGFKIAGTAGYEFDGGLRVEGELFFARAGVDKVTYSGVPMVGKVDVPISGTADQLGGFANVWYDIGTGSNWIPFIGGGIGFVRVDQGDLDYNSNTLFRTIVAARAGQLFAQNLPPVPEISTTDTVFAYHLSAGVGYRLTHNVILQAGYRFQSASDLEFEAKNDTGTIDVNSGLRAHFLEVGIRYRF